MSGYDYALTGAAARVVMASPKRLRNEILDVIEQLAREPFSEPDLTELGSSGRRYGIRIRDRVIVTYWVDHAAKEVRVIRIELC